MWLLLVAGMLTSLEDTGFNHRGSLGSHHLDAAVPLPSLTLTAGYESSFFVARNFIAPGDTHTHNQHRLFLTFAPIQLLEISLATRANIDLNPGPANAPFATTSTFTLGDPSLSVKLGYGLPKGFYIGALLSALFPTSLGSQGFRPDALRMTFMALATWQALPWLQATLNAGYILDNSQRLFSRPLEGMEQFAANVSRSGMVSTGLALVTHFVIAEKVGLGPFVELDAGFANVATFAQNPMRVSVGTKLYPVRRSVELALGSDIRVLGAPVQGGVLPGLPPWEAYARLVINAFPKAPPPQREVVIQEKIKEVTREISVTPPSFTIAGTVNGSDTGKSVASASVSVAGSEWSALAVDTDGRYRSYPLPTGDGLIKVSARAPGYRPAELTVSRGTAGKNVTADFKLTPLDRAAEGELRGSIKDGRSGKTLAGSIFIPTLNVKLAADKEGRFQGSLRAGHYVVLISMKGYFTQKKEITITPGDVVILNIDLLP